VSTTSRMLIRPALLSDAATMLAIYAPIVRDTAISFELDPPSLSEFEERVLKYSRDWVWLVAEVDGKVVGYAYGSSHRERPAYQWSTETSAYVAEAARGNGIGTLLYQALLPALAGRGYCNAYAGIALPNKPSVALHESVGFRFIGTFPSVGRKFNRWHDVGWFHCQLRSHPREGAP
jgi:L-amino acid N-acyltransferase YncA